MALHDFLVLVRFSRQRNVAPAWGEELRRALSDNLVKVGCGGVLELTDEGRKYITEDRED